MIDSSRPIARSSVYAERAFDLCMHFVGKGFVSSPSVHCVVLIPLGWNTGFRLLLLLLRNRDDPSVHFRSMLTPSLSLLTRASSKLSGRVNTYKQLFGDVRRRAEDTTSFLVYSSPVFRTGIHKCSKCVERRFLQLFLLKHSCYHPQQPFAENDSFRGFAGSSTFVPDFV